MYSLSHIHTQTMTTYLFNSRITSIIHPLDFSPEVGSALLTTVLVISALFIVGFFLLQLYLFCEWAKKWVYWLRERRVRREAERWLLEDGRRRRGYGGCDIGGTLRNGERDRERTRKQVRFKEQAIVIGTREEQRDREWWLAEATGEQRVLKGLFRAMDGEVKAAGEVDVQVEERYAYGPLFNMQIY